MNRETTSPDSGPEWGEHLSALMDGEMPEHEWAALMAAGDTGPASCWAQYHLIGDVLRGGVAAPVQVDRVAAVMARIGAGPQPVGLALPPARALPAANDPVFRWKLAAGFATLAAVSAVAWQLFQSAPAAGPQLAQSAPPAAMPRAEVVVVDGVIRDPRLEELLAEHRHLGGVSALQMPAGFLRNATFEAPQR